MWNTVRWKLRYKPTSFLKQQSLRTSYTSCETASKPTEDTLKAVQVNSQDLGRDGKHSSIDFRQQWKPATDTTYGRKLLGEWKLTSKEDKATLFSLASRLGYYGPSIYRIVERDILSLKKADPERYFSFLLENIPTIAQSSLNLLEKAQQETRERSEHLQVYLDILLCSGKLEEIYSIYATSPQWAMATGSTLKPCIYVYSMAGLWLLGDRERCSALLSKVLSVTDVRTKDSFGFAVLEVLRNVERLEEAIQWLEFCRAEQVTLSIPGTFLEPFVDKNDSFMIEKILRFCSEYSGANLVFSEDDKAIQTERKGKSESLLKVAIFLLGNRGWSLQYLKQEQLLGVIVDNIQDLEALYGFLDGLCILNQNIQASWIGKLLSLYKSCKGEMLHFFTPSLLVSLLQRSKVVCEEVTCLALEWAKEQKDFESCRRLLEFLESQSCSVSPIMAKYFIQLAAEMTLLDEISNIAVDNSAVRFFSLKEPSHFISQLDDFLQYLESKGTILSRSDLLEIEDTLENCGLLDYLEIIRKRLQ